MRIADCGIKKKKVETAPYALQQGQAPHASRQGQAPHDAGADRGFRPTIEE